MNDKYDVQMVIPFYFGLHVMFHSHFPDETPQCVSVCSHVFTSLEPIVRFPSIMCDLLLCAFGEKVAPGI